MAAENEAVTVAGRRPENIDPALHVDMVNDSVSVLVCLERDLNRLAAAVDLIGVLVQP